MQGVSGPGAVPDLFGAGLGGFQDGDPATGIQGTELQAALFNDILGNLLQVLAVGGVAPTPGRVADLADAIGIIAAGAVAPLATGIRAATTDTVAPAGWVLASGRTIGDATSNATERADADTQSLFFAYWARRADLQLYTSAGAPVGRGASALADWNTHHAIALPDYQGRIGLGRDNMSGVAANRVTVAGGNFDATVVGNAGGHENHTLTGAEIPLALSGINAGSTGGPVSGGANQVAAAHSILSPVIVENIIIKL